MSAQYCKVGRVTRGLTVWALATHFDDPVATGEDRWSVQVYGDEADTKFVEGKTIAPAKSCKWNVKWSVGFAISRSILGGLRGFFL